MQSKIYNRTGCPYGFNLIISIDLCNLLSKLNPINLQTESYHVMFDFLCALPTCRQYSYYIHFFISFSSQRRDVVGCLKLYLFVVFPVAILHLF